MPKMISVSHFRGARVEGLFFGSETVFPLSLRKAS